MKIKNRKAKVDIRAQSEHEEVDMNGEDKNQDTVWKDVDTFMYDENIPIEHENKYQPDDIDLQREADALMPVVPAGRPKRQRFLPATFRDFVPSQPSTLPSGLPSKTRNGLTPPLPISIPATPTRRSPSVQDIHAPLSTVSTEPDQFGLFREYIQYPTYEPDEFSSFDDLCDASMFNISQPPARDPESGFGPRKYASDALSSSSHRFQSLSKLTDSYAPFPNTSTYHMMKFAYDERNDNSFGLAGIQRVNEEIIQQPGFDPKDLRGFNTQREARKLDEFIASQSVNSNLPFDTHAGWKKSSVKISLPCTGKKNSEDRAPTVEVDNIIHRDLLEVMKEAYSSEAASEYHLRGYKQMWERDEYPEPIRVHGEVYTSDAFLQMESEVLSSPAEPGCNLERVVVPIMAYSDSTHLASFGTASICPGYLWFGSQSKYSRAKPSKFAAHHLVYFPSLPKTVEDEYTKQFGHAPSDEMKTHLKRELEHEVWKLLLTVAFLHAYVHGVVVEGPDGILRRLYPRFFTYSADYPEKILLASIKNLGTHLCPRCTIKTSEVSGIGTREDMASRETSRRIDNKRLRKMIEKARKKFFKHGKGIGSTAVENELKGSCTPHRNAFSAAFHDLGFNYFALFVNDIMHEIELGTFRDLIIHLIRMCHAMGKDTVQELNQRFRTVPTFGRGTIRRFVDNVSELKKLAARDYEDLLQCAPTCFEGLFATRSQEIDDLVQNLLAHMATWHAYAKLRLHTDLTLESFEVATIELGCLLRTFAIQTAEKFDTQLLPREADAKARRKAKKKKTDSQNRNKIADSEPRRKLFNLNTYKFHALGDYPWTIRTFGTTDSYSTQLGELEHRRIKRLYIHTNKIHFTFQIARHEQRRRALKNLLRKKPTNIQHRATRSKVSRPSLSFDDSDPLPFTDPTTHYHISSSTRFSENIVTWLGDLQYDPAFTNFLPKLKDHILERLLGIPQNEREFSAAQRTTITFKNNKIFRHKVIRLNYTTYDMRRNQDSCNPRTHSDIMMLSGDPETSSEHPYWFARIIGVYHVDVIHSSGLSQSLLAQKLDFLFVRWFGLANEQEQYGISTKHMPKLGFIDTSNPESFGFVDPSNVIRGCHIIPAFSDGKTDQFLVGPSLARREADNGEDYFRYYVNMWVDRDMFMRFRGGGVGHKSTLSSTRVFEEQNNVKPGDKDRMFDAAATALVHEEDGESDAVIVSEEEEEVEVANHGSDGELEDVLGPEDGEDNGIDEDYEGFAEY
ncbi:uncharacterized protein C8R40DRAFT_1168980 [Lentinula edodes]|uniref:uncharacterized protein n=1 Tax=Lentinula edodes TaxID=5353 RepID=UPI001E8ECAEF|nr:uncharacterized protein C8R40DRAFT_1168980 [Lentinula edodes]KAH7877053.1 hypothetical protein C8R40DRAFT_1168980 [Lentinula edodes]